MNGLRSHIKNSKLNSVSSGIQTPQSRLKDSAVSPFFSPLHPDEILFLVFDTYIRPPPHVSNFRLKTQLFLCELAFRPHISGENSNRERNFSKMLSREENLKTPFSRFLVDGKNGTFRKR